jgi:4-amino-4-deoxy-L-arabinose transferase-like glycosyltransferase
VVAYVFESAAAACFGVATALQHRSAHAVPRMGMTSLRLAARLVRDRTWLLGRAADTSAVVLQGLALRSGSLLVVQSVVSCGIIVAIAMSAALYRRLPRRREVTGSAILVLGVAMTGMLARPGVQDNARSLVRGGAFVIALALALIAGAVLLRGRGRLRMTMTPSIALGLGAGACFATGSAFLKIGSVAWSHTEQRGLLVLAIGAFVLLGVAGNVLVQRGYQLGEIGSGLSALVAAEPVTALVAGVLVLQEKMALGARGVFGFCGLCVLVIGVVTTAGGDRDIVNTAVALTDARPTVRQNRDDSLIDE